MVPGSPHLVSPRKFVKYEMKQETSTVKIPSSDSLSELVPSEPSVSNLVFFALFFVDLLSPLFLFPAFESGFCSSPDIFSSDSISSDSAF